MCNMVSVTYIYSIKQNATKNVAYYMLILFWMPDIKTKTLV